MSFVRVFRLSLLLVCVSLRGQALPSFDAASVRQSRADAAPTSNVPLDGNSTSAGAGFTGLFVATHQPLWRYIAFAYKLNGTQELSLRFSMFSGVPKSKVPSWVTGGFDSAPEFFDISARAPMETPLDTLRLMVQSLLVERFHLAAHFTTVQAPVVLLQFAKPGVFGPSLRMHPLSDTCTGPLQDSAAGFGALPAQCGSIARVPSATPGIHFGGRAVSLAMLASSLQTMTGIGAVPRPAVDRTGIPGDVDFSFGWVHDDNADAGVVTDNAAAIQDALKQQLGLTLKPSRAPVRFLIVDHAEHPGDN